MIEGFSGGSKGLGNNALRSRKNRPIDFQDVPKDTMPHEIEGFYCKSGCAGEGFQKNMIASPLASSPILAFGIPSGPDLIILLVIVLVLFGAKRLPELARGLGQSVNEFKKAKEEFDKEVAKPAAPEAKEDQKPS
jgi:sec-independent protein translocase protein TatA